MRRPESVLHIGGEERTQGVCRQSGSVIMHQDLNACCPTIIGDARAHVNSAPDRIAGVVWPQLKRPCVFRRHQSTALGAIGVARRPGASRVATHPDSESQDCHEGRPGDRQSPVVCDIIGRTRVCPSGDAAPREKLHDPFDIRRAAAALLWWLAVRRGADRAGLRRPGRCRADRRSGAGEPHPGPARRARRLGPRLDAASEKSGPLSPVAGARPALVSAADIMEFDLNSDPVDQQGRRMFLERYIHGEAYKRPAGRQRRGAQPFAAVIPFTVTDQPLRPVSTSPRSWPAAARLRNPRRRRRQLAGHQQQAGRGAGQGARRRAGGADARPRQSGGRTQSRGWCTARCLHRGQRAAARHRAIGSGGRSITSRPPKARCATASPATPRAPGTCGRRT